MPRLRKSARLTKKVVENSSSDEDEPLRKKPTPPRLSPPKEKQMTNNPVDSSSESDLDAYLKPADQIDLNSSFFNPPTIKIDSFKRIEQDILSGVNKLSDLDSDSNSDMVTDKKEVDEPTPSTSYNFDEMQAYNKKMEEAMKFVKEYKAKRTENVMEIKDMLAIGENSSQPSSVENMYLSGVDRMSSSDAEEDWEEVANIETKEKKEKTKKNIEIVVALPNQTKKSKGVDLMMALKRRLNRIKKENQVYIHKVSLLCWIAHGNYVNNVLNSENLLALSLSLLPSQHSYPSSRIDLKYLEQIVNWYNKFMKIEKSTTVVQELPLDQLISSQISKKEACNKKFFVYIFVCIMRSLGIQCRLIISLQPEPLKPTSSELCSLSTKNNEIKTENNQKEMNKNKSSTARKEQKVLPKTGESKSKSCANSSTSKSTQSRKKSTKRNLNETAKALNESAKEVNVSSASTSTSKPNLTKLTYSIKKSKIVTNKRNKKTNSKNKTNIKLQQLDGAFDFDDLKLPQFDGGNDSDSKNEKSSSSSKNKNKPNLKKLRSSNPKKPTPNYHDDDSNEDFEPKVSPLKKYQSNKQIDVRNDVMNLVKQSISQDNYKLQSKLVKNKKKVRSNDDDVEYVPVTNLKKRSKSEDDFHKVKVKRRIPPKSELNLNKPSDEDTKKKKLRNDIWVEVFLESEEKWICVDVVYGQVHCIKELYSRATHPISYILAWDNSNYIKDVTRRYSPTWNTVTRKLRVDNLWLLRTLKPFKGPQTHRDKDEDEDLERQQLDQPLPKTITEYKDHPLYVLKRHLLKFQAIYPPNAITLGFVRNEPVYSRDCVHTLHSREIWVKHAKVVKPGEEPYKIVKARPKYDRLSNSMITDQNLEIFGEWQVEDYDPPTAENGVVPRNAYGNVDLFKSCMLPKGTVHLQLPGLNKIARKMNIDCAPAVIGFDFHSGWSHPVFDGFVVCKEHEDVVIAAWYMEQEEAEKREQEKIDKRVYGNWRRLINGLLITQRLKKRYDYEIPAVKKKEKKTKLKKYKEFR